MARVIRMDARDVTTGDKVAGTTFARTWAEQGRPEADRFREVASVQVLRHDSGVRIFYVDAPNDPDDHLPVAYSDLNGTEAFVAGPLWVEVP